MDSCAVRITYTARIVVPAPYVALMVRPHANDRNNPGFLLLIHSTSHSFSSNIPYQSAARLSPDSGEPVAGAKGASSKRLYRFEMTRSIPAYLVALAVGDLSSAEIGPRSRVWAEPAMLEVRRDVSDCGF
jgi:hypothetical protein